MTCCWLAAATVVADVSAGGVGLIAHAAFAHCPCISGFNAGASQSSEPLPCTALICVDGLLRRTSRGVPGECTFRLNAGQVGQWWSHAMGGECQGVRIPVDDYTAGAFCLSLPRVSLLVLAPLASGGTHLMVLCLSTTRPGHRRMGVTNRLLSVSRFLLGLSRGSDSPRLHQTKRVRFPWVTRLLGTTPHMSLYSVLYSMCVLYFACWVRVKCDVLTRNMLLLCPSQCPFTATQASVLKGCATGDRHHA